MDPLHRPRLLIADDHTLVLEGIRTLLEADFEIVGTAHDGRELVAEALTVSPDAILLDLTMPLLNGIEAMRLIREKIHGMRFIVMTQHTDRQRIEEAFRAGASAYVSKQSAPADLRTAIHEALQGNRYIAPGLEPVADGFDSGTSHSRRNTARLTPRQREVLQLVAEGKSAKEIAAILGISPKTVEFHKATLMDEIGQRTIAGLTRYAIGEGIVG